MSVANFLKHAWDSFRNRDPTANNRIALGPSYYRNPSAPYFHSGHEGSIVNSIYNRISLDASGVPLRHVRLDETGQYKDVIDDDLNQCLTVSTNRDQTPRAFFQDCILSMLEDGDVAIFPSIADLDPTKTGTYSIKALRKGRVTAWHPDNVEIESFNPYTMRYDRIIMPKSITALIQNPFYTVMNAPNSMLRRLINKLELLDILDNKNASGKMDLIIQLPYAVRSEMTERRAENRRKSIEAQLVNSKYGIAYVDSTERITQLNRPIENNLLTQIEYLQNTVYGQLGLTPEILNGTADEKTILNYTNQAIEPIVSAFASEMNRKFLTKTARSQGQAIRYFQDTFRLVPVSQIAEIADKFIRNEILSSNEFRGIIGFKPSSNAKADELRNPNIAQAAAKEE